MMKHLKAITIAIADHSDTHYTIDIGGVVSIVFSGKKG